MSENTPKKNNRKNPKNDNNKNPNDNQGPQLNWRGLLVVVLVIAALPVVIQLLSKTESSVKLINYSPEFITLLDNKKIKDVVINSDKAAGEEWITYSYWKDDNNSELAKGKTIVNSQFMKELSEKLSVQGVTDIKFDYPDTTFFRTFLYSILPILILFGLIWFIFARQFKNASRGAFSFGKSRAKVMTREKNRITFKDVAGIEESKEEVLEIVDFLRDPKKFQRLGGRIPKGVLLVGPPGTGKTLLAKAIAGEADVPFFSISGSDFVEMFVGVGASRVRDMFEQGKKQAPCIIFIDEIDAVGRHRGHGTGGGHDEREQTLNALLVEMDGFDTQEGVIIIAATNRKDVLDPALLRPGRFDREVHVPLPDVKGREEILRVHLRKIKVSETVNVSIIAKATPGFSGAELANVINEAALIAARLNKKSVETVDLEEARDKVRWGRERRSLAMSEKEKTGTAWHEAGHALLNVLLTHTHPLHKVTIIPRGLYLGATMYLPEGDKYSIQQKEALDLLVVTMGGRIAEQLYSGDISNGASGDISQATHLARRMVCEWGMSRLGMILLGDHPEYVFLGRDLSRSREYSEKTAEEIDAEVKRIIDEAFKRATELILSHRKEVEIIAQALLEFETLDGAQIKDIIDTGKMT
ncbi:MAG: ATP-dependent zinc metalloprotease FtsH, partial [Verrucomicrobiota bacterium]|nr:ATP-dependent zinc metalloprotease FtsH [Verrucomicrobiota bacterium]